MYTRSCLNGLKAFTVLHYAHYNLPENSKNGCFIIFSFFGDNSAYNELNRKVANMVYNHEIFIIKEYPAENEKNIASRTEMQKNASNLKLKKD